MKTIKEFVEELNEDSSSRNKYTPFDYGEKEGDHFYIYFEDDPIVMFDKEYGDYAILTTFSRVLRYYQHLIVEYLAESDENSWFPKSKKYNIIVGWSYKDDGVTAYYKTEKEMWYNEFDDVTCLNAFVTKDELNRDEYMFTEEEIEELKATLPENMAKIVDLGKVEVK